MQARLEAHITNLLADARRRLNTLDAALAEGRVDHALVHAFCFQEGARALHRDLATSHTLLARIQRQGLAVAPGPTTQGPEAR